jgi:hypothetical protein
LDQSLSNTASAQEICSKISLTVFIKVSNFAFEETSIAKRFSFALILTDKPLGNLTLSGIRQSLIATAFSPLSKEISINEVT